MESQFAQFVEDQERSFPIAEQNSGELPHGLQGVPPKTCDPENCPIKMCSWKLEPELRKGAPCKYWTNPNRAIPQAKWDARIPNMQPSQRSKHLPTNQEIQQLAEEAVKRAFRPLLDRLEKIEEASGYIHSPTFAASERLNGSRRMRIDRGLNQTRINKGD